MNSGMSLKSKEKKFVNQSYWLTGASPAAFNA
jgi:hypothetical protein